jgi:hypothetical protein
MNDTHPSKDDLALWVMGALDPEPAARLEAHVPTCAACAAMLAREARLEIALHEVGASLPEPRASGSVRTMRPFGRAAVVAVGVAVAVAAGYLVWIARPGHGDTARAAERSSLVACPPGHGEAASSCHARARRMGLYVEEPPRSAAIPIYEEVER